jgi:short-subunit dehydrogenase
MKILVLGASSTIGSSIVKSFAKDNKLFLLSTKREKLETLKKEALALGCQSVKIVEADLQSPIIVTDLISESIDMIINVACASSSLKNYNIVPHRHQYYTAVDLSSPLVILEHFLKENAKEGKNQQLYYIFINTILSRIQSPDYSIYYSYKILQQEYMRSFQRKYGENLKTINVIVGTQIDRSKENEKSISLTNRIKLAIKTNESEFIFGFEGKIIYMLYRISPLLSNCLIYMKRFLFRQ